jgi:SAM-dependent methyltransferase
MLIMKFNQFLCPSCRSGPLVSSGPLLTGAADIGAIQCGSCEAAFPVLNGVPRFVSSDQYAGSFGFQWNKFRETQLDSFVGLPVTAQRLFEVTQWPKRLRGCRILEAGSGAGRFTEVLLRTEAEVFSFDLSTAVDANMANNGRAENLTLFQASIYEIPFPERHFDKVICLGVLQHTPDPELAFANLSRYVRPGGEIVIDVYPRRIRSLIAWKYLLRPITTRLRKDTLFRLVQRAVRLMLPAAVLLRRVGGKFGARILPIVEYSHLGLTRELNREWAILDTFDMYSPTHDHPRSLAQVHRWFEQANFEDVDVRYGPNGVVGRGRRPRGEDRS